MTSTHSHGHGWFNNAYLLLTLTALFWAGNATAGKLGAALIEPGALTFTRWFLAVLILYPFARHKLRKDWPVLKANLGKVFLLGGIGFTGFNLGLYAAVHDTTAINVTIEQSALPALVMLVNYFAFRQRVRALQMVGVALTIIGVVVTATHGNPLSLLQQGLNRGDAVMMVAILAYAGYTIGLRYKPDIHWITLLFALAVSACLTATPVFLWEGIQSGFEMPPPAAWGVIAYVVIFPSLVSQLFFIRGVELLGSNRAGVFINLVPVFGTLVAVLVAGESLQVFHLLALTLVLGGIAMAERYSAR